MLKALSIKNIAVIENVNIDFEPGFNILSGETGAGKSIIIDSLNLLKGERAQKNIIRNGETKARVDGIFELSEEAAGEISEILGIDAEEELLISREISADGKGSVRVNGVPVTLSMLKSAGEGLITIHGQHDNTNLLSKKTHIKFLDSYGSEKILKAKEEYLSLHREITNIEKAIANADTDEKDKEKRAELLTFQIEEIDMSSVYVGEDDELEERKNVLENAYKIASGTSKAYASLYEGTDMGQSAYDALWTALKAIESLTQYDKALEEIYTSLSDASDAISEGARFLKNYCDGIESTGGELDDIESRLEDIQTLKIKYGSTIELILKKRDEMEEELSSINSGAERLQELKNSLDRLLPKREKAAKNLTELRKSYAKKLSEEITLSLTELCMPSVKFDTDFKESDYKSDGKDEVEFLICTNAGEGLKPLTDIASGGELSRIMLAIKGSLADSEDSHLMIFDEVDTGVSGAAAQKIGEKLWKTSKGGQVICITHLPQIAAMADSHYLIEKHTDGERTKTTVKLLSKEERTREVARTLGGTQITDAAINNASELIRIAEEYKSQGGKNNG